MGTRNSSPGTTSSCLAAEAAPLTASARRRLGVRRTVAGARLMVRCPAGSTRSAHPPCPRGRAVSGRVLRGFLFPKRSPKLAVLTRRARKIWTPELRQAHLGANRNRFAVKRKTPVPGMSGKSRPRLGTPQTPRRRTLRDLPWRLPGNTRTRAQGPVSRQGPRTVTSGRFAKGERGRGRRNSGPGPGARPAQAFRCPPTGQRQR